MSAGRCAAHFYAEGRMLVELTVDKMAARKADSLELWKVGPKGMLVKLTVAWKADSWESSTGVSSVAMKAFPTVGKMVLLLETPTADKSD